MQGPPHTFATFTLPLGLPVQLLELKLPQSIYIVKITPYKVESLRILLSLLINLFFFKYALCAQATHRVLYA